MAIPVSKLKGMNGSIEKSLKEQGIGNSEQFLEAAKGPGERKALAASTGAAERDLLELANRADLSRVKGVAGVFSDLLEKAGVDTVKELAARRPDNLHAKIVEVNNSEKLAGRAPTASEVEDWVSQAKALPKTLTY
ncbi:MAG: DUF4332 domain-containing protein [Pseudomonadota bacterium]|nr:DUF4332 domain-containing protein [Pseudomonadota bacterium]